MEFEKRVTKNNGSESDGNEDGAEDFEEGKSPRPVHFDHNEF